MVFTISIIAIVAIISIAVIITTIVRRGPSQLLLCGQRELDWWADTILFCSSILLHWIHGSSQTQNWWACSENLDNLLNIYDITAILKAIIITGDSAGLGRVAKYMKKKYDCPSARTQK